MKLTKILAMLLALCMILCCFAACGSSDKDDDDDDEKVEEKEKDEDEEDDEEEDEEEDKKSDKEDKKDKEDKEDKEDKDDKDEGNKDVAVRDDKDELEGEWVLGVNISDVVYINSGIEVDQDMYFYSLYTFDGEGEYEVEPYGGGFGDEAYEYYIDEYFEATIEWFMDNYGVDEDGLVELVEKSGEYSSYESFEEQIYEACADDVYNVAESFEEDAEGTYEYDDDELVFDGEIEYEVEMNRSGTELEIIDSDDMPVFVGCVFEKQ